MRAKAKEISKASRSLGRIIHGNRDAFAKKSTRPGQHGSLTFKKTEYGISLRAYKYLKIKHGLRFGQFLNDYKKAKKAKGSLEQNIINALNYRLDAVLFNGKIAGESFPCVCQIICHGFVFVNGKKVKTRSYKLKVGDIVTIDYKKTAKIPAIIKAGEFLKVAKIPSYLLLKELNQKEFSLEVKTPPSLSSEEIYPSDFKISDAINLLSRSGG